MRWIPSTSREQPKVEIDLNGRSKDLFSPFILLRHLGVLGVLCGCASTAAI